MRVITSVRGLLQTLSQTAVSAKSRRSISTGMGPLDAILPGGSFVCGAVHEVLSNTNAPAFLLPAILARSAASQGHIVWIDSRRDLFPPGLADLGVPLDRLIVLRPLPTLSVWSITECLRCSGVSLCVSQASKLSQVLVRRFQLAAEQGGGIGILLRPASALSHPYAAATRWMARPFPGERSTQRTELELVHAQGGRTGQSVLLEVCHETHHVRAVDAVAYRQAQTRQATKSA